jgi:hypothetical protein
MLYTHTHVVVVHKGTTTFTVELLAGSVIPPTSFSLFLFERERPTSGTSPPLPSFLLLHRQTTIEEEEEDLLLLLCMHRRIFNNPVLPFP